MNYLKGYKILLLLLCLLFAIIITLPKSFLQSYLTSIISRQTNFNQTLNGTIQHNLITPTFLHFDHIKIFDFVIYRHPDRIDMFSIFFSGYRGHWKWFEIHCFFRDSNTSVKGVIDKRSSEPLVLCPLPDIERKLVLNGSSQLFMSIRINDSTLPKTSFVSPTIAVPIYPREQYNISIYTMIRDTTHELVEWIEYHLMIGIQHFYLYDHFSSDNLVSFLQPYMNRNIVTVVRWPYRPLKGHHWNLIQCSSMNHALKNFGPFNRWMGYFDVDEYFQIKNMTNLTLGKIPLFSMLDQKFPESKYPGGVQFKKCKVSCFLTQADVISSRYHLLLEKCRHVNMQKDCNVPPKMFLRPRNVPLMLNIHALTYGMAYARGWESTSFGRFRHYNHATVTSNSFTDKTMDRSMDIFIKDLKERIIKYRK